MAENPVEANFVTRFVLGMAVILAMMIGGRVGGRVLRDAEIPYGAVLGVTTGAIAVFVVFAVLYRRYDASVAE